MSLEDIIDWVEENPRDAGIRIFALERENIILERENAALRSLVQHWYKLVPENIRSSIEDAQKEAKP